MTSFFPCISERNATGLLLGKVLLECHVLQIKQEPEHVDFQPLGARRHLNAREEFDAAATGNGLSDREGLRVVVVGEGDGRQASRAGELHHTLRCFGAVRKSGVKVEVGHPLGGRGDHGRPLGGRGSIAGGRSPGVRFVNGIENAVDELT